MKRRIRSIPTDSSNSRSSSSRGRKLKIIVPILSLIFIGLLIFWTARDLPSLTQLEHFEPTLVTKVLSADGKVIKEFFFERRDYVPLKDIPILMQKAIISTEDKRFYSHWGFDLKRTMKAAYVDLIHLARLEGASTITQQLARDLYFTQQKVFIRKIRELITAIQIERTYSKDEIIEMYLNHIWFGHGCYGIKAAAEYFLNKSVKDLNLEESALLAAIVNVPAVYSPINHPERALKRRNLVLSLMYRNGELSEEEYLQAKEKPIVLGEGGRPGRNDIGPYFTEHIRRTLEKQFGTDLYTGGYTIHTTLDSRMQKFAESATKAKLSKLQEIVRNRFKNPVKFQELLDKFVKDSSLHASIMKDTTKVDSLINQYAAVQTAFIAINPKNGHVLAMIGGRDFVESKFNRAVQAKRQPGSAFKPFIYTAVFDNGYPPTFEVLNQPIALFMPDGTRWQPRNFTRKLGGLTTLRNALKFSLNLPSVRLLQDVVPPQQVVEYAKRMGLTTNIRPVAALALGTSEVIPIELVSAYGLLANKGILVKPVYITKIVDRRGEVIFQEIPERKEVLSEQTAYIMTSLLETVLDHGTGSSARYLYGFRRPGAGKTGTTDKHTDAWFVGYTPQIAAGVWVGIDDPSISLGEKQTGSTAALPIWANFMKSVYDSIDYPVEHFEMPEGIIKLTICEESKVKKKYCPKFFDEVFKVGTEPLEECPIHTGNPRKGDKSKRIIF
ncbi:PBP1A family penicillin-binding protein [candidate division KSB1 bacterium]|nr:PBP1A family penicillin-binding protein [candidate division KSB1 bacterium]